MELFWVSLAALLASCLTFFSGFGLGTRSKRFALVAKDGVVKHLAVEASPGELDVSSAESVLKKL